MFHQDKPIYNVSNLLSYWLKERLPSLLLHQYTENDVTEVKKKMAELETLQGTMKLHEILIEVDNGTVNIFIKDKSTDEPRKVNLNVAATTSRPKQSVKRVMSISDESLVDDNNQSSEGFFSLASSVFSVLLFGIVKRVSLTDIM